MGKVLKNHLSLCAFTTAIFFFTQNVGVYATYFENVVCSENVIPFQCADGKRYMVIEKTYQKTDENKVKETAIAVSGVGTIFDGENIVIINTSTDNSDAKNNFWKYGLKVENSGSIEIGSGTIYLSNGVGVYTSEQGKVALSGVSILDDNIQAINKASSHKASAFQMTKNGGYIVFTEGTVKIADAHGISLEGTAGWIDMINSTVVVNSDKSYGIRFGREEEGKNHTKEETSLKKESYILNGEKDLFGSLPKTDLPMRGDISLKATSFTVPNSTAIYSKKSGGLLSLSEKSEISGDVLLTAESGSLVKVAADASTLVGGVRLDQDSSAEFRLTNNSKWTLSHSKDENSRDSHSIGRSSISLMHLIDSSIVFAVPRMATEGSYQTLRIGKGEAEVYKAQGEAHIYFNTYLNEGGDLKKQKTDRLLIHGHVSGKTTVHVQGVSGSPGGYTGSGGNRQGISIIQVSGNAEQDSFKLYGDYVTLDNSPYQYILRAYGPTSALGQADASQRLVEGNGNFWDFRLESQLARSTPDPDRRPSRDRISSNVSRTSAGLDVSRTSVGSDVSRTSVGLDVSRTSAGFDVSRTGSSNNIPHMHFASETDSHVEKTVQSVVPQVPTYLLLSNSLFHIGLMDISNQNKQLEILRTTSFEMLETHKSSALFSRGYGGNYRYTSDLSVFEYGYSGDLGYHAVDTGILLHTIENADNGIFLGLMGSYGTFSLKPLDVAQSQKSTFDKWSVTAYGSMQHNVGLYVDGLLSYGLFQGDVLTRVRGKTATLKGKPFSASLTGGKIFTTGYEGLVFDPQIQVAYQHLQFNKVRDIDNFDIDMGKLDQWMVRVGGLLTKTLALEKDHDVSFYSKLSLSHSLEGKQSVHFKDAFKLGAFGSSLEAGLGFKAQLFQKFTLYGDFVYQHKLTKAGFSGTSFSGGLRYRF